MSKHRAHSFKAPQMPIGDDAYISTRLQDQINWYESKCHQYRLLYKYLRALEILLASLIPFLTKYFSADTPQYQAIVALMGVAIAVITGIVSLFKYQEHEIDYRTTAETLKHENFLYSTESSHCNNSKKEKNFSAFVNRVKSIISKDYSARGRGEFVGN